MSETPDHVVLRNRSKSWKNNSKKNRVSMTPNNSKFYKGVMAFDKPGFKV